MFGFLKEWYLSGEEKWYSFWDKVNAHLPVYGIIDAIDSVVPSFALFLILLIFVLLFFGVVLFTGMNQGYEAQFTFFAPNGTDLVYDSVISFSILEKGISIQDFNQRTDADGKIYIKDLIYGQEIEVKANLTRGTYLGSFIVDKSMIEEDITLQTKIDLSPKNRIIIVKDALGMNVREPVQLSFYCENRAETPIPETGTTTNSSITVKEPYNCVNLHAKVLGNKFEQRDYVITGNSYDLYLVPYEPPAVELKVKVRTIDGYPVNDTSFNVTITGDNIYTGKTLDASQSIINVVPSTYTISIADPSLKYAIASRTISVNEKTEVTISVTKAIRARIKVNVKDKANGNAINEAIVSIKNSGGKTLEEKTTNTSGIAEFALTDVADYEITAKKPGDTNGGYFSKAITLNAVSSDANIVLELEKITTANAGRTKVQVVDQDNLPVSNAKVMLKYQETDSIVELNRTTNWAMTDLNGYTTFLAGKVEGLVVAYAIKYPFTGSSNAKLISMDQENEFKVIMQVGDSTIKINLTEENGEKIDGTARIVSMTTQGQDLSGLISIEQGSALRKIKAGQVIYLAIQSSTYEDYVSEPIMLFPNKTYTFNVMMKKQISEPRIKFVNVYNSDDAIVRTLQKGKKYYAKFILEADQDYSDALMHFRVGKEELLENDFMQIDKVESVGITRELRGTSYSPTRGYSFDSENTTDGYAKWINVEFDNLERGQRVVKAWFDVKKTAPENKELQFFWRANFDGTKDPPTTNTGNDLYDDVSFSNIYFVGVEATCQDAFCITNESLYWTKDDLYISYPYELKQAEQYTYKYQIFNNSDTEYGANDKKIYLNLEVLGDDGKAVKVLAYKIKDASTQYTGSAITKINNMEIKSFNKNSTIDVELILEGNAVGTTAIKTELKADGVIIYTTEQSFTVPTEKQLNVSIAPSFMPSLVNTELTVTVADDKGEPVNEATVKVFAKEPGFEEYLVDETKTNRIGKAAANSGAHFQNTKVIIEVTKEGYARMRLQTTVSEDILATAPEQLMILLNTITQREATKKILLGNLTVHKLKIVEAKVDQDLGGIVNEAALGAYVQSLIGTELDAEEELELEIMKVRLNNAITQDNFLEPINVSGNLILSVAIGDTYTVYDKKIPFTIDISSEANTETSCLILSRASQTKTTQQGQVRFDFELLNACSADGVDVGLDNIYVTYSGELYGIAELSLVSPTSGQSGRTALDGAKRKVYDKLKAGEKLVGAVTYSPSKEAVGQTISMPITIEGRFQGKTIKTNPAQLNFTVNILNLKECMSISSDAAPVAFDAKSNITVDASACLGQAIEVALCKNDAGCSGGAEGKITLTKRTLNLKGTSETIEAYNPTLPGSYGVSVWARVKGKSSFNYIGEVPVSFRESEDKYFKLSKYDLMLVGSGSEDIVLLRNEMLTQSVDVKANDCIWGEEDAEMGMSEWMMVASAAMMGSQIGNMIGSGFSRETTSKERTNTEENMTPEQRAQQSQTETNRTAAENNWRLDPNASNTGTNEAGVQRQEYTTSFTTGEGRTIEARQVRYTNTDGTITTQTYYTDVGSNRQWTYSGDNSSQFSTDYTVWRNSWAGRFASTAIGGVATRAITPISSSYNSATSTEGTWFTNGTSSNYTNNESAFNSYKTSLTQELSQSNVPNFVSQDRDNFDQFRVADLFRARVGNTYYGSGGEWSSFDGTINASIFANGRTIPVSITNNSGYTYNPTYSTVINGTTYSSNNLDTFSTQVSSAITGYKSATQSPAPKHLDLTYANASLSPLSIFSIPTAGFLLPSYLENTARTFLDNSGGKKGVASFAAAANPTSNYGGWGSLIGAIAFGVLAYIMVEEGLYQCGDNYDVVSFTDFVIFLQGDSISVTSPDGETTEERELPSDAGALGFTLGGIGASWDFSNADYSEVENVAIKFNNGGLNDPKPRYGTLTINAAKHIHGTLPGLNSTESNSTGTGGTNDFDVWCRNANFGNYWIGDSNEQGLCSGVSEGTYSQKYHIRVESGEPQDEEAYLKKASSCYNGVLTGSTGPDALPKVKLNWDWDKVTMDACDYTNENYSYCDQSQFMITLVKKLATLENFLNANQGPGCPSDPLTQQVVESYQEINSITETVADGYIGPEDASIVLDDDEVTIKVNVNNKTGETATTYYAYSIKGQGAPTTDISPNTDFASGTSELTITANVPTFEGVYFFTIVFNGPNGTRRALTRAFENREPVATGSCWLDKTTRPTAGIPTMMYYYAEGDTVVWNSMVPSGDQLFNYINFGSYLIKDSFSDDFLNDFKSYYLTNFLEQITPAEREILEKLNSSNFNIAKRFSGDTQFEAGLHDVWLYIDFGENFSIIDDSTKIEVSTLLVKTPTESYPFYYLPFDGMLGYKGTRQGYGTSYKNLTEGISSELEITPNNVLNKVTTFEDIGGNGVVILETKTGAKFVTVNSTPGTRGQLASVSYNGLNAQMQFTPNYATPVIIKKSLEGTSGKLAYIINEEQKPLNTGGNLSYWTGAARSRDFFGSAAIDLYNDSPDYKLESGDEYGFTWIDATNNGNLYLKTVIFAPTNKSYIIESKDSGTTFWTPNDDFVPMQQLVGINGMSGNSQLNNSSFDNLQQLFDMVSEGDVCVSNDGSSMTFWWNPRVLEVTPGSTNSLANQELALIGQ